MSNVTPSEVFELTAKVYGVAVSDMRKRASRRKGIWTLRTEARFCAVALAAKHTQMTYRDAVKLLGLRDTGANRDRILTGAIMFDQLLFENLDVRSRVLKIEDGIDALHERPDFEMPKREKGQRRAATIGEALYF